MTLPFVAFPTNSYFRTVPHGGAPVAAATVHMFAPPAVQTPLGAGATQHAAE